MSLASRARLRGACLRATLGPVHFEILYCGPCGYREQAEALARELRGRFGATAEVEEGKFGQFDVLLDGELVASKGGFWRRKLVHGAPPQPKVLAAIESALALREGEACAIRAAPEE